MHDFSQSMHFFDEIVKKLISTNFFYTNIKLFIPYGVCVLSPVGVFQWYLKQLVVTHDNNSC